MKFDYVKDYTYYTIWLSPDRVYTLINNKSNCSAEFRLDLLEYWLSTQGLSFNNFLGLEEYYKKLLK